MNLQHELGRKTFHLAAAGVPATCFFLEEWPRIGLIAVLLMVSLSVDILRRRWLTFGRLFNAVFGRWLRDHEARQLTGATYFLLGCFLTAVLFRDRTIAIPAMLFLAVGDAAAALVGWRFGRLRIGAKTLEGSLACFLICWLSSLFFVDWQIGLIGAGIATLIELAPLPFNDNLTIPVTGALAMTLAQLL